MGRKRGGDGGGGDGDGPTAIVPAGALDPAALGFPLPPGMGAPSVPPVPTPPPAPPAGPGGPSPMGMPGLGQNMGLPGLPSQPGPGVPGQPGLSGAMPPGHMPPGHMAGHMPPGHMPPGHMPPGQMPPGHMPPGHMPPGHLPPGHMPPGHMPPGPGQMPPGHMPPGPPGLAFGPKAGGFMMGGTMPPMPGGCGGCGGLPLHPGMGPPSMPKMPMPGMGPPGSLDSEALAQMRFQQVASEYEQIKSAGIDPQVQELAEYHQLDERATRALDEEMKKRRSTFESDLQALWVGLEGSKNPSGMLMMKLKDMRMGVFKGMTVLDKKIQDFAKRNRLDAQAAVKLGEVMENRDDVDGDLSKLSKHLERSNKPSSLVMMMLRTLREGKPIKDPEYQPAIGSKVHERELRDQAKDRDRSRSRPRGGRDESRGGRHDRDRGDRDRGRERDRDRDRDRDRRDDRRDRGDRERGDRGEDRGGR